VAHFGRRQFLAAGLGLAGAAVLAGCSDDDGGSGSGPTTAPGGGGGGADGALLAAGSPGLVDEALWQSRIDRYLATATTDLDPANPVSVATHLIAAHRDPAHRWEPMAVTVDSLQPVWEQLDEWRDTRDFRIMYLHWMLALADGSSPATTLDPAVIEAIDQRLVDNRYRYDDPLPDGRIDDLWFWSENHILIGLVGEYLAGQRLPDRTFTITGLTGAEHAERSKAPIIEWVHERARFGFFEWHSHVYMKKNVEPLLTLIQFADDPELVAAAAMGLDLCILDMAAHNHQGSYTASRGRTYAKDKTSGRESTFNMFKLLFDDAPFDHTGGADTGASFFAGCERYRPPQALIDVAVGEAPGVTRERHGIFVDGTAPITDSPEAPFGYDFDDPANLPFWWSQGAIGLWQLTGVSLAEAERYRILETEALAPIRALVEVNGGDPDRVREFVQANHDIINFGHLQEANTYAWRSDEVAMATVLDHRFGQMRDQIHTWQATIDPEAYIFTTHPRTDLIESDDWAADEKPGYWTGEASIPRSAQHERTAVHIYQPSWDESTSALLWGLFGYQDFTHAFVPQERFDEVVRDGNWTFARKGTGYIALWSWREPTWRAYDPATNPMVDMTEPYDLVAEGGPDNVWIVEVGDSSTAASFDDFRSQVTAADPEVERSDAGFTVAWTSPTSGEIGFGSTGPFTVDGDEQQIDEFPRHESRWGTVQRLGTTFALESEQAKLVLDFESDARTIDAV
jgi:hypothetical protein